MVERVKIVYQGRQAIVPADQVKNLKRKEKLVQEARILDSEWKNATGINKQLALIELQNHMSKIIRINRQIPPCVQFID